MSPPEAFFLPMENGGRGQRFCLAHPAAGSRTRGTIVYVHPFAEEMNKSRRMAALQSRALAAAGFEVLQVDLCGCGDSSGGFGDATWRDWVDDVLEASLWAQRRSAGPLWLWGLRAGCLVAADAAQRMTAPCHLLFWQPTPSGKTHLQQFLRLKVAGDMLNGNARGGIEQLQRQLAAGSPVHVAGYALSANVAAGLEAATLEPPAAGGRVEWIELSTRPDAELAPAAARCVADWRRAGLAVRSRIVQGPAFWQTSEIETAPALIDASVAALQPSTEALAA